MAERNDIQIDRVNISELHKLLKASKRIVLVGHINPDGDCIGSLTGIHSYLNAMGLSSRMVVPSRYADFLEFLIPQKNMIIAAADMQYAAGVIADGDLVICMDFNALSRIDEVGIFVEASKAPRVLIDHHPQPANLFDLVFSRPDLSSASELTWWIIRELSEMEGVDIPLQCCESLYTGMMTDTNNFSNSVVPSTFWMASELISRGVDKEKIQNSVLGAYSESRMRMMGYLLYENMMVYPELNAAVMTVSKATKERFCFKEGDLEGLVNLALNIKGIKVSGLISEADDYLRVSLRSKGEISVNALSRAWFNGGGHERAAGGRLAIGIGEAEEYFRNAVCSYIKEHPYKEGLV